MGRFQGGLAEFSAPALGAIAIRGALARGGVQPEEVEEVFMGNVLAAGVGQAPGRQAALGAGLPVSAPCTTVNKVCASGLKAVMLGFASIKAGVASVVVAGGMESMSNVPYYLPGARDALRMGHRTLVDSLPPKAATTPKPLLRDSLFDTLPDNRRTLVDGMIQDGLWDPHNDVHMGACAEACAERYGISREQQDDMAISSFRRALEAREDSMWEITPVERPGTGEGSVVDADEGLGTLDEVKLRRLKPAFAEGGTITAGNASQISDGAAAVVLASQSRAEEMGAAVLARVLSVADAAQEPKWFTTTPALAVAKVVERGGLTMADVDYFEINEAFAVVELVNRGILGLDSERVNAFGGAVAVGHPIGCSGARILVTLVNVLRRRGGRFGVAAICNGGGGASAVLVERVETGVGSTDFGGGGRVPPSGDRNPGSLHPEEMSAAAEGPLDGGAENERLAEEAKVEGNRLFKEHHFALAIESYSRAIELNPNSAIYYSNRAAAHIRLENYGSALADATKAMDIDPKYIKAYYRRGDANFAMGKFKEALKDLKKAAEVAPKDPDLRKKLSECAKAVKRIRFEEAVAVEHDQEPPKSETIQLETITVEDSYQGPKMQSDDETGQYVLTLEFVQAMMEEFKEQRLVHKRFAYEIILTAQKIFKSADNLVYIDVPEDSNITICGDVHGQYYDLLNIFDINGAPSEENPYLFNGDFVDRGSFSVEVILVLLGLKCLYPDHFHLTRGNHESRAMNKIYGFDGEVKHKYNSTMAEIFRETFCWMPLAFVLNRKVLVLHGGLFTQDDVSLEDINKLDRNREPPDEGIMCEILWSDPSPLPGRSPSQRGVGVAFGADVTKAFLDSNNLELVVRSHEVKEEGYEVAHDGRLITIFSAPNYCDSMGNKGAFLKFSGSDMVPHFTQFSAVPHPSVRPMAYANSFLSGM
eukprot:evm.model.scf_589.6 EVM.evm.TU.scf_589.6   scf_589:30137-41793(+)